MADVAALCPRIILILKGKKRFDGSIKDFEKILGREKFVSLYFSQPVDDLHPIWQGLNPVWSRDFTSVELKISEEKLREITIKILDLFPVVDYGTEKLPIERVLEALVTNPELIR
jgi:ABC-2 type transport system ATP-binding protein